MRFIHISDLHIGKRLYGFDLEEDQRHIFDEIIRVIKEEKPDGVLIAGDIYDRADPSAASVRLFDDFLNMLSETGAESFIIYGNHDSPQRAAFGSKTFARSGIHIARVFDGEVEHVDLEDEHGKIRVYMLPFLRAQEAREVLAELSSEVDTGIRNVLISHQFMAGSSLGDSEEMNVGNTDSIDAGLVEEFDYVALGHLHVPQDVSVKTDSSAEKLVGRYSGSPICYSFSEAESGEKTVTVVELGEKDEVTIRLPEITPLHEMTTIKGGFDEIINDKELIEEHKDDYLRVILTDESEIIDAMSKLQIVFPYIMTMEYEYIRASQGSAVIEEVAEDLPPEEMFNKLYEEQHDGGSPSEKQKKMIEGLVKDIWEGGHETC